MNYTSIYNKLITQAQSKVRSKKDSYFESHHIVPKSMNGSNKKENKVLLTAKEHFVAHHLLWKIHKNSSMALAFLNMKRKGSGHNHRVIKPINAKDYERIKKEARIIAIKSGKLAHKNLTGFFSQSIDKLKERGNKIYAERKGLYALSREEFSNHGRTSAKKQFINEKGIWSQPKEKQLHNSKIGGIAAGIAATKKAEIHWWNSLSQLGLPTNFKPTTKVQARQLGLKYYWGKICTKHPEEQGKRRSSNTNCTKCWI